MKYVAFRLRIAISLTLDTLEVAEFEVSVTVFFCLPCVVIAAPT